VPPDADKEELEAYRLRVEDALTQATEGAEEMARKAA
jgi:hypothetical protein